MKKQINFADINSAEEFRTRFITCYKKERIEGWHNGRNGRHVYLEDENGELIFDRYWVSVGCYWPHLKQFMTKERVSEDQLEVYINYSNWSGTGFVRRFV